MEIREKQNRIDSVTGMRGIACICIVCFHFYCLLIDDYGLGYDAVPWVHSTRYFFEYSKNAVELFFISSRNNEVCALFGIRSCYAVSYRATATV